MMAMKKRPGRPRKDAAEFLPLYVRVRNGAYHYSKPGGPHKKLCRVSHGIATMHEMLDLLIKQDVTDGTIRAVKAKPVENEPGIYLMFQKGTCVYVGQSINVKRRVGQRHRLVDRVVMLAEADPARRDELEAELIRLMNPKHNVVRRIGQRRAAVSDTFRTEPDELVTA